jgi:hypothetical protein
MLTTQSETSIIERMKIARGSAEPEAPTEEPEIVDVSEVDTTEEIEEEIVDEVEESTEVNDELDDDFEESESDDDADELYLDLDGEEIPLSQVKEWKSGNMRQADYTRKTTELAEQRKALEAEQAEFNSRQAQLTETVAQLQSVIETEELSAEELQELRDYEPEKYIEHVEKQQKRKEALEKAKGQLTTSAPTFDAQAEQAKLLQANPHWLDNGKPTEAYQQDLKLLDTYAQKVGITAEKFATFDSSMMQIMLDAARFTEKNNKSAEITKRVRKAPVTTRPKQQAKRGLHSEIEKAESKFKRSGSVEDAVALRKLKAKLNN